MARIGDVTLNGKYLDRFEDLAGQGATTVYSVAGVTFRQYEIKLADDSISNGGGDVQFEAEPDNKYDKNAVKVLIDDTHIGYVKMGSPFPLRCHGVVRLTTDPVAVWLAVSF